jgi:hypothetical protein
MGTVGGSYSWNALCDVCGFQYKANELKKRWDGLIVCEADYETRHPLDFYRAKDDTHVLPFTRPDPVVSTGFLPLDVDNWPAQTTNAVGTEGQKFTVKGANRKLVGLRFLKGTTANTGFVRGPGLIAKLWDSGGTLLKTWKLDELRYDRQNDAMATASVLLTPAYTLTANATYTISVRVGATDTIYVGTGNPTAETYLTHLDTVEDNADVFPSTVATGLVIYMDIITRSDN